MIPNNIKLTLYLLEDDVEYAKSLLNLFAATHQFEVLGHAMTIQEARDFLLSSSADVYLLDISLPDGSSIDFMSEIKSSAPNAKILVLSTLGHEKQIVSSLKAGASGYLLKSEMPDKILQSIITVANDGGVLGEHVTKVLIKKIASDHDPKPPKYPAAPPLSGGDQFGFSADKEEAESFSVTHRELEILKVISRGLATKQVANELGISAFTVNQHLRSIFKKLKVRNRMEAVRKARDSGLL